jgi:hypothetical protein
MNLADWVGSIGVGLLLIAYVLDVTDRLEDDSPWFFALNLVGATLASTAAYMIRYWPFVLLEGTWALVSAIALLRRLGKAKAASINLDKS